MIEGIQGTCLETGKAKKKTCHRFISHQPLSLSTPTPSTFIVCVYRNREVVRFAMLLLSVLIICSGSLLLLPFAIVHIVEIDPLVISASIQAMGFPAFSFMTQSGDRASAKPDAINEVMWRGIHERLYLYEADAEEFINNNTILYDMIFIDAYDGKGIFPHKLRDPDSPFLKALSSRLHPKHGTVVVNLVSDSDVLKHYGSVPSVVEQQILTMGKYMSQVCQAYKDVLVGTGGSCEDKQGSGSGLAFTVEIPRICNISLVVCRGFGVDSEYINRDSVVNTLISKSLELKYVMDLPFSCLEYIKRGFVLVE